MVYYKSKRVRRANMQNLIVSLLFSFSTEPTISCGSGAKLLRWGYRPYNERDGRRQRYVKLDNDRMWDLRRGEGS